jgi:phage regulator Rha-like protein
MKTKIQSLIEDFDNMRKHLRAEATTDSQITLNKDAKKDMKARASLKFAVMNERAEVRKSFTKYLPKKH